ncbi:1-deoxy-D-xylulose-5-phosphate synthase [Chromatocurvus halotolerans]|uniref:1-deoxy-D-xylulose-5-phosphate synthase n=1 Tax=Chromatocurvus halotolerans TaxID=1132028 RepID=A0A4R2KAE8_9GAMM|nr:1-deoxy-D-xylulose-5-phosphate synthase [Chromatocurvus halotolerans]TCO70441.1 1-deoxy-D-xylulose-5-phosphate synthase [Chromatocurvus halotolerans]
MFSEIPATRPETRLLDEVDHGRDIRELSADELLQLADDLRAYLLYSVGQSGGHFGAGLGVVELTIALHHIYNTPEDRIVWDVGHQAYPHKILTGRMQRMHSMRQAGGLSGFPKRSESEYDTFGVGHSSTSISAAMGMALAARAQGLNRRAVAVIGDGAITGGMAFEALAHAGHVRPDMLVVLNDNQMSIGYNTGGLAAYFAKLWASKTYITMREGSKKVLKKIKPAWDLVKRTEEHMKGMVAPGTLFEELGWHYIGPIDGHDLPQLVQTLENMRDLKGPQFLHICTMKGKGFKPAEADPIGFHAINKIESRKEIAPTPAPASPRPKPPKYQDVFGRWLCDMAREDDRLIAITPAMCEGSGMVDFARTYPDRFYDVAIAEQHAVTLAAGMACDGVKPVVAIYSTFLQRAYDQLIHDVALQNLDVTFAIDRAGLVGQDGPTHHGAFDLSYLRCIPNMVIGAPSGENECRQMLYTAYQHEGPAAIRYPRGNGSGELIENTMSLMEIGKGVMTRKGNSVAILNFGALLDQALQAAETLDATVIDMRWVKPMDEALVLEAAAAHELLVTVEENASAGGAGSGVEALLHANGVATPVIVLGIPDNFQEHGDQQALRALAGLSAEGIYDAVARMKEPEVLDSVLRQTVPVGR